MRNQRRGVLSTGEDEPNTQLLRPTAIVLIVLSLDPTIRADYLDTRKVRSFIDPFSMLVIANGIDGGDEIGLTLEVFDLLRDPAVQIP